MVVACRPWISSPLHLPSSSTSSSSSSSSCRGGRGGADDISYVRLPNKTYCLSRSTSGGGMVRKQGMLRRSFNLQSVVATAISSEPTLTTSADEQKTSQGMEILPYRPEGYSFWSWRGHKIHDLEQGEGDPIVLIHGFGASVFHWRYNIPELSKHYKVYALDLLGFGWSEKALIEYDATLWSDQVSDFLKDIVKVPAVLIGNSLGGFTALLTAAQVPEHVCGVALLNSAGQFGDPNKEVKADAEVSALEKFVVKPVKEIIQRIVLAVVFWQSKQPSRIRSVLKSIYPDSSNVDDYLIESITRPTADPNSGEVYYRLMTRFLMNQQRFTLDSVLSKLSCPLLLLWGELDPWVDPTKAKKIREFYPNSLFVSLPAGHCPHDEVPMLANEALVKWLSSLKTNNVPQTL